MINDGLVKLDKFTPSKRPYAIDLSSAKRGYSSLYVDCIWAGRKNGRTTASFGTLNAYRVETVEELIEKIDMRYGGCSFAKWDGDTLITPSGVTQKLHSQYVEMLDAALNNFPAVPDGYEGWYYRR